MSPSRTMIMVLAVACFVSALAKVYTVHAGRAAFTELQRKYTERDAMNIEWGQLQIEEAAWSTHSRIERIAATQLSMRLPEPDEVVIVQR